MQFSWKGKYFLFSKKAYPGFVEYDPNFLKFLKKNGNP
jgi:hypothetical protein